MTGSVTFRATAGVNYKIAVDGHDGASGNILLTLALRAQPSNDNFANRAVLAAGSVGGGQNLGATTEFGEANHAGVIGGKSVWWTWTPPSNSCVTITTAGSDFDTVLAVYTNSTLANLVPMAANDDASGEVSSAVTFKAVSGTPCQIAVDGYNRAGGNVVLQVLPFVGPTNDNFANSTLLTGTNIGLTLYNICATAEVGEPDHGGGPGAPSLWWHWQAPASGGVTVDLDGTDFFTALTAYTGSTLGTLSPVESGPRRIVFKAIGGATYRIAVNVNGQFSNPATAKVKLSLTFRASPPNDDFANRVQIGSGVTTNGSTIGATTETNEPLHQIGFAPQPHLSGKTVWWSWNSFLNFPARVTVRSTNLISIVTIYTGASLTSLTRVAGRVGITPTNEVNFSAIPSTQYLIAVDGVDGAEGYFDLTIGNVSPATNDNFASRITLNGANVFTIGWNKGASREVGEPNHANLPGVASVWWSWTAPGPGRVFLNTRGSTFSPLLGVYQGATVASLANMANPFYPGQLCPGFSFANFDVSPLPPQTFHIAVDGELGSPRPLGGIDLTLAFIPKPTNDDFALRVPLSGSLLVVTGSVVAASQEAGEVVAGLSSGLRTVWHSWTAPTNLGPSAGVTLRVTGIDFPSPQETIVGVFQGNSLATLTAVPTESEQYGDLRQVRFQAQAGAIYQIVVAGNQFIGGGLSDSLTLRRGNLPPNPLAESGSFVLRLNCSALALRIRNVFPANVPLPLQDGFGEKIPVGAEAQILNYGQAASNPVRVRLLAVTRNGIVFGDEGNFAPASNGGVSAGGIASIPISGACMPGCSVIAVLEEQVGGDWFARDSGIVLVGFTSFGLLCTSVTGGGVILLEPGLSGQCFCPPILTGVQINGPVSVNEGNTAAYWGTAFFNNGSTPNFTNTIWSTSDTNRFPITTNGILTAGSISSNTPVSVVSYFTYVGVTQSTNKLVTVQNLPPPTLTNFTMLPNRNVQLSVQGVPGRQHVIEATTNLAPPVQWIGLVTNATSGSGTPQSGSLIYTDQTATNFNQRFYRAREY